MIVAIAFTLLATCAGYMVLRTLGLAKGATGFGLAPAAGVAALAVAASWCVVIPLAVPLTGVVCIAIGLLGLVQVVVERRSLGQALATLWREQRTALGVLALAAAVPCVVMATAFGGVQVPLSPHDGAFHTQVIHAFRSGQPWADWYPKGVAAVFGAVLQLVPWIDSAQGAVELGMSLLLLAVLAVFGLGLAIWRNLLLASLGALLLSLTYLYPYFPQIWSGWPLATGLILVMGLWALALDYLDGPNWRWAVLAGLVLGSMVLVHGTELYSTAIVLLVVAVIERRRLVWRGLARHIGLGLGTAVVCAAPYLPTLLGWASAGGAYAVGMDDGASVGSDPAGVEDLPLWLAFFLQALGIDLPLRLVLLAIGAIWAVRRRSGGSLLGVGLVFAALTLVFVSFGTLPGVRAWYAATFPWGMHYRLLMLVAVVQPLLAAAGLVASGSSARTRTQHWHGRWGRRGRRLGRLVLVTWLLLAVLAHVVFVRRSVAAVYAYSADDAAAMAWLRANVPPGVVVVNDGFADAGIWAPYKAGVEILILRSPVEDGTAEQRALVAHNILRLDAVPEASAAACQLNVRYLYRGAAASEWDTRRVPPVEELSALPYLEPAFNQGDANVFSIGLGCVQGTNSTGIQSLNADAGGLCPAAGPCSPAYAR